MRARTRTATVLVFVLSGCASYQPDRMYDGDHPLSDTTVLSAFDDLSGVSVCTAATIQRVDDKETSRGVFPGWVRVKPGTHSFVIHCSANYSLGYQSIHFNRAELSIKVQDMRPRHIYVARYRSVPGGGVGITVDDLGENSSYTVPMGGQLNRQNVKAEF